MAFISGNQAEKVVGTGIRSVIYRDTAGKTWSAVVVGEGAGADQLDLKLGSFHGGGGLLLTDVDKATAVKQTDVWYLPQP